MGDFTVKIHSGVSLFSWSTLGNSWLLSPQEDAQIILMYSIFYWGHDRESGVAKCINI